MHAFGRDANTAQQKDRLWRSPFINFLLNAKGRILHLQKLWPDEGEAAPKPVVQPVAAENDSPREAGVPQRVRGVNLFLFQPFSRSNLDQAGPK